MTDYYKTALNLLIEMLKDSGYDNWINWLSEDIRLWDSEHTTEHHLRAYGGMGSFNDVVIGDNTTIGLWRGRIFGTIQTLAYSLAKGDISTAPLNQDFYGNQPSEISGWRCRNCGHAIINNRNLDIYLASYFIPKFFLQYLTEGNLAEILNIEKMVFSEEVKQKHHEIASLIKKTEIIVSETNDWLWICPKCGSSEVCAYRWIIADKHTKLLEANDNLEIRKLN
jgi:predicted RNA-binding Zn-ribbon protein involved in translation (DUF1610 family)